MFWAVFFKRMGLIQSNETDPEAHSTPWGQRTRRRAPQRQSVILECTCNFESAPWSQLSHSPPTHYKFHSASCVQNYKNLAHHSSSPVLTFLHWLNIEQRIQYKVISITYKTLQSRKPIYLNDLLHIPSNRNTRSSDTATLQHSSACSRLTQTEWSFTHHAPVLWNSLPEQLRQPTPHHPCTNQTGSTLALSSSQFHTKLKTSSSADHSLLSLYVLPPYCQFSGYSVWE